MDEVNMDASNSQSLKICANTDFSIDPLWNHFFSTSTELEVMREIVNAHLFHYFRRGYVYVRCFEKGLAVSEHFMTVMNENTNRLSVEEQIHWFDELALLKLYMLDHLNWFELYLRYFDELREINQRRTDCTTTITEMYAYRYNVVKRKYEKSLVCPKIGNLLCHQQCQLSPEEIERRYNYVIEKICYEQKHHTNNIYF